MISKSIIHLRRSCDRVREVSTINDSGAQYCQEYPSTYLTPY